MVEHFPGMEEVVGSCPRGGRNFSHGKLSKIPVLELNNNRQHCDVVLYKTPTVPYSKLSKFTFRIS